jgi:hypothetical protein
LVGGELDQAGHFRIEFSGASLDSRAKLVILPMSFVDERRALEERYPIESGGFVDEGIVANLA